MESYEDTGDEMHVYQEVSEEDESIQGGQDLVSLAMETSKVFIFIALELKVDKYSYTVPSKMNCVLLHSKTRQFILLVIVQPQYLFFLVFGFLKL